MQEYQTVQVLDDGDDEDQWEKVPQSPTSITGNKFNLAYAHFNEALFDGKLPPVLITLQRHRGSYGYFSPRKFKHRRDDQQLVDEVALNPAAMQDCTDKAIASTLVHEMTHVWQDHFGNPPKRAYHNKEWANKMEANGLMPTSTGEVGGKRTGRRVSHMVIDGGPFDQAWQTLDAMGFKLDYHDRVVARSDPAKAKLKVKYTCPGCNLNLWGRPAAHVDCRDCGQRMTEATP
jgi:predicted SprT family Zn-dependent metalloprotease